ncbi:aldose 1-epimerase [Allorhizobium pseudoryzae]|uniref:aldose epimerase family protein n=1 Tax=Allorhizobium pseudoryzae TaxID=379684 RepID=UPI003D0428A4
MPSPDGGHGPDIEIRKAGFRAAFRPMAGGRMTRLYHADFGELLVPMADQDFAPFDWPKAGAYPLFPFHNRVKDGRLRFEGRDYRIAPHPALVPDAMHGPAQRRPWSVKRHAEDAVSLALDYQADKDWPFDFRAEQEFSIEPNRLLVTLRLTNNGRSPMSGGLGWHPYFRAGLDCLAATDAEIAFPLDSKNLPTTDGVIQRAPGPLPADTGYTIHFTQWQTARLDVQAGAEMVLLAKNGLPHLAVHRMETYICLEPVSHRAGALGLDEAAEHGFIMLAAGEMLEAAFEVITRSVR